MSATEAHSAGGEASVGKVDMRLEVDIIPVSDVDISKDFYERLGWRLDADVAPLDGFASSSSRPRARLPRLRSVMDSLLPRPAPPREG
jgi:hypothetical protein